MTLAMKTVFTALGRKFGDRIAHDGEGTASDDAGAVLNASATTGAGRDGAH